MSPKFTSKAHRVAAEALLVAGIVVVVLMVPVAAVFASSVDQDSISRHLAAAAAAEKARDYAAAAAYYRQVLEEAQAKDGQPASLLGVRVQLAKDYFLLQRYEESLKVLEPTFEKSFPGHSQANAQASLVAGMDDLGLNRLPAAIGNLQRALALDPQSGTARLALGDAYARSKRLEEAAREYREQLKRTPSVADGWYKLGIVYSELSAKTVQDFEQRDPKNSVIRRLIAERLLEKGDSAAALHLLLAILRTDPRQPDLRADLGTALLDLGHTRAAMEQFQTEILQNSESPAALLGLAEADALLGNWEGVFRIFIHLIRFHPRELRQELEVPPPRPLRDAWQQGHLSLPTRWTITPAGKVWANWLSNSGTEVQLISQGSDANCALLSVTLAQTPGLWLTRACYQRLRSELEGHSSLNSVALAKLAESDFRLGQYERSRAEAAALARRQPLNGWAAYWLARSYDALAYSCFDRLSSTSPDSARMEEMIAQLDASHFNWNRAEKEYKSAIRLAPGLPDLHLGLGTVYWQAGNWIQAEKELEKTLKLDPASPVANYELGDCYVEQHRWPAAIPRLQRAIADSAVNYRARLDLAQAEEQTGNDRGALQDLLPIANQDRDGVLHYRLALLYRQAGDPTHAQEALAQSQSLRRISAQTAQQQIDQAEDDLQKLQTPPQPAQP